MFKLYFFNNEAIDFEEEEEMFYFLNLSSHSLKIYVLSESLSSICI
jgi:hypothetical protein